MAQPLRKAIWLNSYHTTQQFPSKRNANMPIQNPCRHLSEVEAASVSISLLVQKRMWVP